MTAHALPMRRPKSISRFTNRGPAVLPGCIGRRSLVDAIGGAMREYDILQRSRLLTGVQRVWSMCTPVGAGTDTTDRSWWSWMCGLHRRCIQRCATVAKNESLLAGDVWMGMPFGAGRSGPLKAWSNLAFTEPNVCCGALTKSQSGRWLTGGDRPLETPTTGTTAPNYLAHRSSGNIVYALRTRVSNCLPTIAIALYQGRPQT